MTELTSRERFARMFEHKEADRVPITDYLWNATIERWRNEGMPADAVPEEYLGFDLIGEIEVDNSPQFETKILEEAEDYKIETTAWGATMKNFKHSASTPEFLDFHITDPDKWKAAKGRMRPETDRIPWAHLKKNYKRWREKGHWIRANLWFGFDVTHSWTVGTERLLMALVTDPEWCVDMFNHFLDVDLALLDMVWDAGYEFDCVIWPDDMGYKHNQFFSLKMYRELLKPVQKRAAEWAHQKGVRTHLHSCGNINPFIPELIDIGIEALNPLEVKAGMDPLQLKKTYGQDLVLHGGINILNFYDEKMDQLEADIRKILPVMMESGGYIFASDHSIPSSISLENMQRIIKLVKELGHY